jgi:hypothetical protein
VQLKDRSLYCRDSFWLLRRAIRRHRLTRQLKIGT